MKLLSRAEVPTLRAKIVALEEDLDKCQREFARQLDRLTQRERERLREIVREVRGQWWQTGGAACDEILRRLESGV